MARQTLPEALRMVFGHEGGYSNVKTDSGGPTKYGITHKTLAAHRGVPSVTAKQVEAMTLDEATDIYATGYWAQSGGDVLPVGLDYAAFDFGVNSGPHRAVVVLQKLLGVRADGSIGPQTMAAVKKYRGGVVQLIHDYCEARMAFLRSITNKKTGFPVNGRGWTIRVTGKDPKGQWRDQPGVLGNAIALAEKGKLSSTPVTTGPVPAGGNTKAETPAPNPWLKPETVLQALPFIGGLSFLFEGTGPVQWAIGVALVVGALVTGAIIYRRVLGANE